jgi:hypothetical protein
MYPAVVEDVRMWKSRNDFRGPSFLRLLPLPVVNRKFDEVYSFAANEGKHGTLRVLALDNPATAGHLHRTINDLPATRFNAFDSSLDGIDVEVEVPT